MYDIVRNEKIKNGYQVSYTEFISANKSKSVFYIQIRSESNFVSTVDWIKILNREDLIQIIFQQFPQRMELYDKMYFTFIQFGNAIKYEKFILIFIQGNCQMEMF